MSLWGEYAPYMDIVLPFYAFFIPTKMSSTKRIGAHNIDVLSVIFGSMLGDSYAETRNGSTRICIQQENSNVEYLNWLHRFFANRGYCNPQTPNKLTRVGKKGHIRYYFKIKTWSFQSFNWVQKAFYVNNVKVVPCINLLYIYLSPLALAVWVMDDGTRNGYGLNLATNCFTLENLAKLQQVLYDKYNLKTTLNKCGVEGQFVIYIWAQSMPTVCKLIKPYLTEAMVLHKLGQYVSALLFHSKHSSQTS